MGAIIKDEDWVWVVIQSQGVRDDILGQIDEEKNLSYVPFFMSKEDGLMCLNYFAKNTSKKHEIQAVMYEDVKTFARSNGFVLFKVSGEGKVEEMIDPSE